MAKPGRNDPCPCGSGNKYKRCCLAKDEAASKSQLGSARTRAEHTEAEARRALRAASHLPGIHELKTAIAARLGMSEDALQRYDQLMDASNAVVELVHAGKLDEAEQAARDLLVRFPDVHDGYDRLGMVHEARGENRQAADCYRKVIAFIRQHPTTTTTRSKTHSSTWSPSSTRRPSPDHAASKVTIREGAATTTITRRDHGTPIPPSDSMATLTRAYCCVSRETADLCLQTLDSVLQLYAAGD